jgi:hypothetical protein
MIVRRFLLHAMSATLLVLPAAAIMTAQSAQADTARTAVAAGPVQAAASTWYYTLNCTGGRCTTAVACTIGGHAVYFQPGGDPVVVNDCAGRIWLHANRNGTGYQICISPGHATGTLKRIFLDAQVTSNTAQC